MNSSSTALGNVGRERGGEGRGGGGGGGREEVEIR